MGLSKMSHKLIYWNSDNIFELTNLKNTITTSFINDSSSVFLTIIDAASLQVNSGPTWPVQMVYVQSSNGKYRVTIDRLLDINVGSLYNSIINASEGANVERRFDSELFATTSET